MTTGNDPARRIDVHLRRGGVVRVALQDDDTVRMSRPGGWRQDLRRREAWALSEALDAIATAAEPGLGEEGC